MKPSAWLLLVAIATAWSAAAGPYSSGSNDPTNAHDPPVPGFTGPGGDGYNVPENHLNPRFVAWAATVVAYQPADSVDALWSVPANALGPVTGDHYYGVVSLGERAAAALDAGLPPGFITLGFTRAIADGPGADFAVFENGFYGFVELAFVEVSTDGATFARFPAQCAAPAPASSGHAYLYQDPTDFFNLAGKHVNNSGDTWGTPFDLSQLATHPAVLGGAVDLQRIRYVKVVDIPGRGDFQDSSGRPVYDSWPTFGSAGFDLEAVGVIHQREELAFGEPAAGLLPLWCASSTNRVYQLLSTPVPATGTWDPVGLPVTGTGGVIGWSVPAAASRMFRLAVSEVP